MNDDIFKKILVKFQEYKSNIDKFKEENWLDELEKILNDNYEIISKKIYDKNISNQQSLIYLAFHYFIDYLVYFGEGVIKRNPEINDLLKINNDNKRTKSIHLGLAQSLQHFLDTDKDKFLDDSNSLSDLFIEILEKNDVIGNVLDEFFDLCKKSFKFPDILIGCFIILENEKLFKE